MVLGRDNSYQKLKLNSSISIASTPQLIRFDKSSAIMGILPMGVLSGAPQDAQNSSVHRLYGTNTGDLISSILLSKLVLLLAIQPLNSI